MESRSAASCPYCGEPKDRHEYASPTTCVLGAPKPPAAKDRARSNARAADSHSAGASSEIGTEALSSPGAAPGNAARWQRWERRWLRCPTCLDFGMVEQGGREDVCPTCEGGLWRERESWESWLNLRLRVLHFQVSASWPFVYLTSRP